MAMREGAGESVLLEAGASGVLGRLYAMRGEIERGRQFQSRAREVFREAGLTTSAAGMSMGAAWIEHRAGDLAAWELVLRSGVEELERLGDRAFYAMATIYLAECLCYQGRFDEVEDLCAEGRRSSPADDRINFVYLEALEGGLLARRERFRKAEEHGRRAVGLADETDFYFVRAESRLILAETLSLAGRSDEAAACAAEGLAFVESKGDVARAARARERLDEIGIAAV